MGDTDVFLQLEKQLKRSPTKRRTAGRSASDRKALRKKPSRVRPDAKPIPSSRAPEGAKRPAHDDAAQTLREHRRGRRAPEQEGRQERRLEEGRRDVTTDVTDDVMTSILQGVNKKLWRELIEETETHNSSLRISQKEREQIEDVVRDLKRQYRIKTSMNEIARLGLLFLAHDFRQRGKEAIIADVKTA